MNPRKKKKSPLTPFSLLAPIMMGAVFFFLSQTVLFDKLENITLDQRIKLRTASQPQIDNRIFLIGVDDISLEKIGQWPFDRAIHAQFMQMLANGRPDVFTWDVMFDTYSGDNNSLSESDRSLADVCSLLEIPVITAAATADEETRTSAAEAARFGWNPGPEVINSDIVASPYIIAPFEELASDSHVGIVTANRHDDGVVRRIPFVVRVEDRIIPSLTLATLIHLWDLEPEKDIRIVPGEALYIESPLVRRRIPIDRQGYYTINYRYELEDMIAVQNAASYVRMVIGYRDKYLRNETGLQVPDIAGKAVFIGQVAAGLADLGRSPLTGLSPLVMTHINTMDNILKSDYLIRPGPFLTWGGFLLLAYLTFIPSAHLGFWLKSLLPLIVLGCYVGLAILLFQTANIHLALISPGLAFLFLHGVGVGKQVLEERQAKEELKDTFSAYVAPGVLNSIYDNPEALKLGGAKKDVAILFTDIRSFTSMTEVMDSEVLVAQLNEYFTEMVTCINKHGGTLHKFIGDAIMAVWGDITVTSPTIDAGRALQAAIDMRNSLALLNQKWIGENRPEFHMGVGINFGRVTAGNIGAPQRMEFTVIGDPVNLAARLESLNKKFGTEILIGESMHDLTHERFLFRSISKVQVVGKQQGVQIYEALCATDKEEESPYQLQWVQLFEEGYARFMERRFDVAARLFEACLNERPQDKTTLLLLESCRTFIKTPPGRDWNGTFEMTSK